MTLKEYIQQSGKMQKEIAHRIDMRTENFSRVVNCKAPIPKRCVPKLAMVLGISVPELMSFECPAPKFKKKVKKKVIRGDLPCGRFSNTEWLTFCRYADNCASASVCPIAKFGCGHKQVANKETIGSTTFIKQAHI